VTKLELSSLQDSLVQVADFANYFCSCTTRRSLLIFETLMGRSARDSNWDADFSSANVSFDLALAILPARKRFIKLESSLKRQGLRLAIRNTEKLILTLWLSSSSITYLTLLLQLNLIERVTGGKVTRSSTTRHSLFPCRVVFCFSFPIDRPINLSTQHSYSNSLPFPLPITSTTITASLIHNHRTSPTHIHSDI